VKNLLKQEGFWKAIAVTFFFIGGLLTFATICAWIGWLGDRIRYWGVYDLMDFQLGRRAEMVCVTFTVSVVFLVPGVLALYIHKRLERQELEKAARENPDHYLNVLKRNGPGNG
jgi:hypothetical protein